MNVADAGGVFCQTPVDIAISEAQRLFPHRPLGVIMSFGLSNSAAIDQYCEKDASQSLLPAPHCSS